MNQIIQTELWVVLIFCVMWVIGQLVNLVMLGLLARMARELHGIMELIIKEHK